MTLGMMRKVSGPRTRYHSLSRSRSGSRFLIQLQFLVPVLGPSSVPGLISYQVPLPGRVSGPNLGPGPHPFRG